MTELLTLGCWTGVAVGLGYTAGGIMRASESWRFQRWADRTVEALRRRTEAEE